MEQAAKPSSPEPSPGQPDAGRLRSTLSELVAFSETLALQGTLRDLRAARSFLAQVDAAVLVLAASQPFTAAEQDLVREVVRRAPRVLLVANKIDQLAAEDRQSALEFIEQAAGEILGADRDAVFPVSAREGEGMAALRRRLRRLATGERMGTLARSLAGIVAAAAAEVITAARLERRARELPLNELRLRVGVFQDRIGELRAAGEDAATLLEDGVRRALSEHLDRPLESWARAEGDRLVAGRLRTLMPGRLGRRMLIADAEERLVAMADRHAGRLRAELHERVVNASRCYRQDLAAGVEQAIIAMTQALDRAATQHTSDQDAARARLTELAGIVERCELIAELGAAT